LMDHLAGIFQFVSDWKRRQGMAFREVLVTEVKEVLRAWLAGAGKRPAAKRAGVNVKTAARYIAAAREAGLARDGDESQLTDELIGQVVAAVRPARPAGHGASWEALAGRKEQIAGWVKDDLTLVKVSELLERSGTAVPYRTLARFAAEECGYSSSSRQRVTVPVADGKPGEEVQVDFGYLGMISDGERRRKLHALVFTAVYSRYCFVFLTFSQTTEAVIAGCEAAWGGHATLKWLHLLRSFGTTWRADGAEGSPLIWTHREGVPGDTPARYGTCGTAGRIVAALRCFPFTEGQMGRDKVALFAMIREDRRAGMGIRAIARKHGVHRRTVHEALVFEKPGGGADRVPAARVAQVLGDAGVPVVVLNACQSGAVGKELEAAVATRLLAGGASAVVAMAYSVYAVAAACQGFRPLVARHRRGRAPRVGNLALFRARGRFVQPGWHDHGRRPAGLRHGFRGTRRGYPARAGPRPAAGTAAAGDTGQL
jgi:transposase